MAKKKFDSGITEAMKSLKKKFGDSAVLILGDVDKLPKVEACPTGILSLDLALGCGGLPRGRIVEIYGPYSHGKTSTTLRAVAQVQRMGGTVAFIDAEHALDIDYAARLGVDMENLIFSQPDHGEMGLETVEELCKAGVSMVVVDSVVGLVPKAEIEGEIGDNHMGLMARLMGQGIRKINKTCARSGTVVVFINQIRMKLGVMFGNPEDTPGGLALKFYSSVRMEVRTCGKLEEGEGLRVGNRVRCRIVKNKVGPPFRTAEFDMYNGMCSCHPIGVDHGADLLELAITYGLAEKGGAGHYSFAGQKLGQGRVNVSQSIIGNPKLMEQMAGAILEAEQAQREARAAGKKDA